jgi:hypothetical protein
LNAEQAGMLPELFGDGKAKALRLPEGEE